MNTTGKIRSTVIYVFVFLIIMFKVVISNADITKLINYQGRLTDNYGTPIADNTYSMTFKICSDSGCTGVLWTETKNVVVSNGLFSTLLGDTTALTIAFNQDTWVEVTVTGVGTFPTQRLAASPYAYNVPDSAITSAKINDGTIATADIGDTQVTNAKISEMDWTKLQTYPASATCAAGQYVTQIADAITCGTPTPTTGGGWTDGGTSVYLTTSTDKVGIGDGTPTATLDVTGSIGISDTTVIDASRNISNVVNFTNTGNTTLGDAAGDTLTLNPTNIDFSDADYSIRFGALAGSANNRTLTIINNGTGIGSLSVEGNGTILGNTTIGNAVGDTLTIYPDTTTLTGSTSKTIDVNNALDTTLNILNSTASKVANLVVDGSVTAASFSGSSSNALACSGDATCEVQSGIQTISNNSLTIDALSTAAATTITLTNSNATYDANVNIFDGALQFGGTSVIDASRNISNVVNFTNTGTTTIGNATGDTLTLYPGKIDWDILDEDKTIEIGGGAVADRTLFLTNPNATYKANLNVEGTVTAPAFSGALSGTATNANACSGDATCETSNISTTGTITATGALSGTTLDTGNGANELYAMNQNVRTTDSPTFATITATGEIDFSTGSSRVLSYYGPSTNNYFTKMEPTATAGYGTYGPVSGDWALYNRFSGTAGRGWIWQFSTTNIAGLSDAGNFQVAGTITTPGYVSITGVQDTSGNLRFSAANPYIYASSYFVAPGGAYFSDASKPVYTEATIQARGGIADDGGNLTLSDAVDITGGILQVTTDANGTYGINIYNGTTSQGVCYRVNIPALGTAGVYTTTNCVKGYMVVGKSDGGTNEGFVRYPEWDVGTTGGVDGYFYCCWATW